MTILLRGTDFFDVDGNELVKADIACKGYNSPFAIILIILYYIIIISGFKVTSIFEPFFGWTEIKSIFHFKSTHNINLFSIQDDSLGLCQFARIRLVNLKFRAHFSFEQKLKGYYTAPTSILRFNSRYHSLAPGILLLSQSEFGMLTSNFQAFFVNKVWYSTLRAPATLKYSSPDTRRNRITP